VVEDSKPSQNGFRNTLFTSGEERELIMAGEQTGGTTTSSGSAGAATPGSIGATAGGNTATTNTGSGGTGSSASSVTTDWTTGLNDDFKGFVQNKGWKDTSQVVESYRNLEKLVGAPADQIIKLAKEDDAAGWESIYSRLGRPANADGYKLETPKEGGNPEFTKWAANEFHKVGLNEKQAKGIVDSWNKYTQDQGKVGQEKYAAKLGEEQNALKKEWGAAHDQNIAAAKRAAREFGVDPTVIDGLEKTIGFAATMKHFQAIGAKLGESSFVGGNGNSSSGNGPMTPVQAMEQIKTMRADPGFVKRYIAGDVEARSKMEQLHKYAYPDA
jgi:hypothetical protein